MSIETEMRTVFIGTQSSPKDRKALMEDGFVHVTGLTAYNDITGKRTSYVIGERLGEREGGKWDRNNGVMVLVTAGGEVWLRTSGDASVKTQELIRRLCPNGQGAFVPLSNGETVPSFYFLQRLANPYAGLTMPSP